MSKKPTRGKGAPGVGRAAAGVPRRGKTRAALYESLAPEADEVTAAEEAFEPVLGDFAVPRGVSEEFEECRRLDGAGDDAPELVLGRVIRLDRGYPLVACPAGALRAEHAISLVKGADVRSAVGDWVAVRLPGGHEKARIERILARTGELSRWDGSARGERQVLAANLDVLLVAQQLSKRPLSGDRIARSLVVARQGRARAAVVLTKADRSPDAASLARDVETAERAAGAGVEVVVASCAQGRGVEDVRALIPAGGTALLLGESGAGKSTLVNALLGAEVLGVGAVRGRDDQGRHTTVARRMLKVPRAGVLVDAPGLRSLPLLDEELGLARAFPEVAACVPACRFRDCTHGSEPGCAVRAGVEAGEVDPWRLEEYRALAAEMLANRRALDPSAKASLTK